MNKGLESDGLWLLGFVGVFFPCVNLELLHLGGTKFVLWDHALDGPFEDELGTTLAHLVRSLNCLAADVTGVTGVDLMLLLTATEFGMLGVDDNDKVAGINVRRKNRLMFSAKETGCLHGDFPDDLVFGINNVP